MTSYWFFKMAAIDSESYFRVQCQWLHSFKMVKNLFAYHCRDKTTSDFEKRTAAILEFYFRFRFWPMFSPRHVILLQPAKVRQNPAIHGGVMTSYRFSANVNSCSCSLYVVVRPSVCHLSSLCNVRAPHSSEWNFPQCFRAIWYVGDLKTSR